MTAMPRVATVSLPLAVEEVAEGAAFSNLSREWDELLDASESDCVFLTWEWLHTWWKHLAAGRRLAILAVRRGGELVAIAPFCLQPRRLSRALPFSVLEFLEAVSRAPTISMSSSGRVAAPKPVRR